MLYSTLLSSTLLPAEPCAGAPALRVLVVDDVHANRELLCMLLENWGHETESTPSGQDAVQRVAAGGIDLVLMDLELPGISGLQATQRIRALPGAASRTPVWAVSAHSLDHDVARARESGVDGHLSKPVMFEALRDVVDGVVAQR